MEEGQNQAQESVQETVQPQENKVSFPTVGGEKKNGGAKTLLIIGILVLVGILGYVIYKSASGKNEQGNLEESLPYNNLATPSSEETVAPTSTPAASPAASVDKEKLKVQVQNGTGITGEAAYLQNILKELGFTNVTVGNATSQDNEDTQVSFSSTVPASVVTEVTNKLNATYKTVTKVSTTGTAYDIVVITGLRKGATAKPSATPTSSPTPKASPTATP